MPTFRIAVIATAWYHRSHTDVIASRWLVKREADAAWGWNGPRSRIVSIYVDQPGHRRDMSRQIAREHEVPVFPSVREALCCGGDKLAVDGVMIIGEHGDYPLNELGQKLYPRKELFDQVVQVFRDSGRSAPVFNDKHYSWNPDWAREMVQTAEEMGFLLTGGSSIPLCRHEPPLDLPAEMPVRKAVAVYYAGREAYAYHSIEFALSVLERRRGGESGIRAMTTFAGADVWRELERRGFREELLRAAERVAPERREGDCRANLAPGLPEVIFMEHADGLEVAHLDLKGHVKGWSIGLATGARGEHIHGTAAFTGGEAGYFPHFATMAHVVETALMENRPPFAPQRVLLSSMATAAAMRAFAQMGQRLETPELKMAYQPAVSSASTPSDRGR